MGVNFVNPAGSFTAANGSNNQGVSGPGCDRLSASPNNTESGRRTNTLDALIRYRGSFGGFGIAATAGYIGGNHVQDDQTGVPFNSSRTSGTVRDNYDGLNIGDFGLAVTYAGFTVGGKYQVGRYNGQFNLAPKGLPDGEAWLAGASYTIGPVVVGLHYLNYKSAGDIGNAVQGRQRQENGVAFGGTYSLAPGVSLFLSGLWQQRKQNGYNFITGQGVSAAAPGGNAYSNKVRSDLLAVGTSFSW